MKKKVSKGWKIIGFTVLILVIGVSIWYIIVNYTEKERGYTVLDVPTEPKKYEVNEYTTVNIDGQSMASIYLQDFLNIMYNDYEKAYYLLDKNYREAKFGSPDEFKKFVDSYDYSKATISKYGIEDGRYDVYDQNDNIFIFVTEGVMQYKVYLDADTVVITNY